MTLQWYPGHMARAMRELTALMPSQDVVIEVCDARLPIASSNPLVTDAAKGKPIIKVLTKSDLADPKVTAAWLAYFARQSGVSAFASTTERPQDTKRKLRELTAGMSAHRGHGQAVRALIAGVPNVGKSTLVNTISNKKVADVGDKPAVTKEQQRVVLDGIILTDSPGLSWHKFGTEPIGLCLALAGSIPDTALDYVVIASFAATFLIATYPQLLMTRYKLDALPADHDALLAAIARKRGKLRAGGALDLDKAAEILVHEFRDGTLGRISLEAPPV